MATGTAQQAREVARQKFIDRVQKRIDGQEFLFGSIHRIFLHLLNKQLASDMSGIGDNDFPKISRDTKDWACNLFGAVLKDVKKFRRSKEEGDAILEELLEWVACKITRRHKLE